MIKINENYYIESDGTYLNVILKSKYTNKEGLEAFRIEGYYSNIEGAINAFKTRVVNESCDSFKKLQKVVDDLKNISIKIK